VSRLPVWYTQLSWKGPYTVAEVNARRSVVPATAGLYAFTEDRGPLVPNRVLYIGETGQNDGLRGRLASYLVDFTRAGQRGSTPSGNPRRQHKGKGFILEYRSRHTDHGMFLRWVEFGGSDADRRRIEASLINYFNPKMNDREDDARHPLLGQYEPLDPRLLG